MINTVFQRKVVCRKMKLKLYVITCPGNPVACVINNSNVSDVVGERSCYVNHSSNTVPHFNCSRQISDMVLNTKGFRQAGDVCSVSIAYNVTTLTVNERDLDIPLECDVNYCSPTDSSQVYLTEHFVLPQRIRLSEVQDTTASGKCFFCSTYAVSDKSRNDNEDSSNCIHYT